MPGRGPGARAAALAILAALAFATPAAADVLVSNMDSRADGIFQQFETVLQLRGILRAQGFTTGSHEAGYTLNSIELLVSTFKPGEITVQLASALKTKRWGKGPSHTVVATLTSSSQSVTGAYRFAAPTGIVLDANTKYWVVVTAVDPVPPPYVTELSIASAPRNGVRGKYGWSTDNTSYHWYTQASGYNQAPYWKPSVPGNAFLIRVNGTESISSNPVITISGGSAVTEGTAASFTVTSDRAHSDAQTVNLTVSEPTGSDYVASSDEGAKTVTIPANATTATYSVATQAKSAVEPHGSVTVRLETGTGYILGTNSGASVAVHEATPAPLPATGLTASHSGATAIDLAWALPTQPAGVTVSGLEVQQQSAGSWTTVASLGAGATSHTVTGLSNGTSYAFRVRVAGNHGTADSETVSLTALALPRPATGLTLSNVTGTTIDLSWTLPEQGAGVVVSKVEVHMSREETAWGEPEFNDGDYWIYHLPGDATSATESVRHGGTPHHFRVRLFTNTGSVDSEVVSWSSPLPLPNSPTNLTLSNVTGTTVDLSWTLPAQGEGGSRECG